MPEGYGDGLLSLEACKQHLRVDDADDDSEDLLILALRDAAIEYVERYCAVKLAPVAGLTWRAEGLPHGGSGYIDLAVRPVTGITGIGWLDSAGAEVAGAPGNYRFEASGRLRPAPSLHWPSGVAGGVVVTFDAGYPAGEAPPMLLAAVRMMLGHLYLNREAVIVGTISGEAPLGVTALCSAFRPVLL